MKSLIQKKLHLRKSRTIQNYTALNHIFHPIFHQFVIFPPKKHRDGRGIWINCHGCVQVPRAESVIKRGWEIPEVAMEGDHQWKTIGEPQESGDLTILNHT